MADVLQELDAWIDDNWDPDLTVGQWWERLGTAGWAAPALPAHAFGKDLSRNEAIAVSQRLTERGALGAPGGLGMLLAAPTIAIHGTPEQIERFVRPISHGCYAQTNSDKKQLVKTAGSFGPGPTMVPAHEHLRQMFYTSRFGQPNRSDLFETLRSTGVPHPCEIGSA